MAETLFHVARGELSWSLLRGGIYSAAFLVVMVAMDLVSSWWALLVVPAALFAGIYAWLLFRGPFESDFERARAMSS